MPRDFLAPPALGALEPITTWPEVYLYRTYPLGGIPLARAEDGLVCLLPDGDWVIFSRVGTLPILADRPKIQSAVIDQLVDQLGGTSAALAARLGISPRNVEGWRSGRGPLPFAWAWRISGLLLEDSAE